MFKKSLLALSVATLAASANAGTIYSSATDGAIADLAAAGAGNGQGAVAGFAGDENCDAIATELGLTLGNTGNGEGGDNDTATAVASVGVFTAGSVVMTGAGTCNVTFPTVVSSTPVSSSIEAAQNTEVQADAALVSGIGGYDVGDTITVEIQGASIDKTATEALVPTLTDASGTATINVLDVEPGAVRFTVVGAADTPAKVILNLDNVVLDATGLGVDTEVTYNAFATNTSGTDFDISTGAIVANLVPQYSATVTTALDGIIDVAEDRNSLELNADDNFTGEIVDEDTFVVTISEDATGTTLTPAETVYTFSGDFSWMIMGDVAGNDDGTIDPAEIATLVTYSSTSANDDAVVYALNEDQNELTATTTFNTELDLVNTFVFAVDNTVVLNETDYTVAVTVNDDASFTTNAVPMVATAATSAGAWTLNGSVVTIPYMPFDDNTAVIMRHTNTGVQSGDISVRYMLEGVSTNWETAGVIGTSTRGVQNIRNLVINAIKDAAGVTSGKVAIEITTNVPEADVTVYAAFRVKDENDRGFVGTFGEHGSAQ